MRRFHAGHRAGRTAHRLDVAAGDGEVGEAVLAERLFVGGLQILKGVVRGGEHEHTEEDGDRDGEELRPVAIKNVTGSLVLGKVAEAEKPEVTEADIDAGIDRMTEGVPEDKREEFRKMVDTPETRESINRSMVTRKTIDRLVEIAKGPQKTRKTAKEAKE